MFATAAAPGEAAVHGGGRRAAAHGAQHHVPAVAAVPVLDEHAPPPLPGRAGRAHVPRAPLGQHRVVPHAVPRQQPPDGDVTGFLVIFFVCSRQLAHGEQGHRAAKGRHVPRVQPRGGARALRGRRGPRRRAPPGGEARRAARAAPRRVARRRAAHAPQPPRRRGGGRAVPGVRQARASAPSTTLPMRAAASRSCAAAAVRTRPPRGATARARTAAASQRGKVGRQVRGQGRAWSRGIKRGAAAQQLDPGFSPRARARGPRARVPAALRGPPPSAPPAGAATPRASPGGRSWRGPVRC